MPLRYRCSMRVDLLTREYPPEVYGGAGVHVEYLGRELARLVELEVHCWGDERSDPGVHAYRAWDALAGKAPHLAALQAMSIDLAMTAGQRQKWSELAWGLEVYHRGLKQHCGVERAQVRAARAQRNHITCALRAFLRLEQHRLVTGTSWWAAKAAIIREAIRAYRAAPLYALSSTA